MYWDLGRYTRRLKDTSVAVILLDLMRLMFRINDLHLYDKKFQLLLVQLTIIQRGFPFSNDERGIRFLSQQPCPAQFILPRLRTTVVFTPHCRAPSARGW